MKTAKFLQNLDYVLLIAMYALAVFGIIIIGSAVHINTEGISGNFINQIIWLATGSILMLAAAAIDYRFICRFYIVFYVVNIVLLVLVLLIGQEEMDVKRWLFGIQPSEFSKIFMLLFLSKFIDKNQEKINNIGVVFFVFISTAIPFILIKEEPSLSAGLVLFAILVVELFMGRINVKYIIIALIILAICGIIIYVDLLSDDHKILSKFVEPYHIRRMLSYIKPDPASQDYYQTKNSIWAIGSGKLTGKGLYNGTINQLSYLPYSHNDFIFSVIGEEFGFLGCLAVLFVTFVIVLRCIITAWNAEDNLGRLLAAGVAGMIAFQSFTNVGVTTGLLPNTGMPYPFLSYGGSSMWINMIAIGLVLNVGMKRQRTMF